eukprot:scaffold5834_cov57-Skeletonema_menzelii.AAC.1
MNILLLVCGGHVRMPIVNLAKRGRRKTGTSCILHALAELPSQQFPTKVVQPSKMMNNSYYVRLIDVLWPASELMSQQ